MIDPAAQCAMNLPSRYLKRIRTYLTRHKWLLNGLVMGLYGLVSTADGQSVDSVSQSSDNRFTYQLHTTFQGKGDHLTCSVSAIAIVDKATGQLRQRIRPEENDQDCQQRGSTLVIEDMNFDGYNDLRIRQLMPAAPNIPYYVWLYDPQTRLFTHNAALEEITSPVVDRVQQRIRSAWRANCCEYGEDTYGYLNGQLTLLQQTETTLAPNRSNRTINTVKQRVNGKMSLIRQTTARINN